MGRQVTPTALRKRYLICPISRSRHCPEKTLGVVRSTRSLDTNAQGNGNASTSGGDAAKAWPFGKYVCGIDAGLPETEELMQCEPTLTQSVALEWVLKAAYK